METGLSSRQRVKLARERPPVQQAHPILAERLRGWQKRAGSVSFQLINEHPADGLIYDPSYLGINRTDDVVFIQITLNAGRTLDQKRALYKKIAELLSKEPAVRPEDVVINLIEVAKENWSFGNGDAPYAK